MKNMCNEIRNIKNKNIQDIQYTDKKKRQLLYCSMSDINTVNNM